MKTARDVSNFRCINELHCGVTNCTDESRMTRNAVVEAPGCVIASMRTMAERWRLSRMEWLAIAFFWLAVGTVSALNRLVDPRPFAPRWMSPVGPVALAYTEAVIWAILTPAIFWISSRATDVKVHLAIRAATIILAGLIAATLVTEVLDFVRVDLLHVPRRRMQSIAPMMSMRLTFLNQLMLYLAVLAAGFAREYWHRDRIRQQEAERMATQAAHLQAQLAQARLESLRMQINPHFLFNTLHAISALVDRDAAGVRKMVARLSELLRYTLDSAAVEQVPLDRELGFVRRYLEIMEIRFQGRLEVAFDVEPGIDRALVPTLILQPIVENAMKHGASHVRGTARVVLSARSEDGRLFLTVRDSGPGPDVSSGDSGIGLRNTRERLHEIYGAEASLSLRRNDADETVAEIVIPYRTGHADDEEPDPGADRR
jgi:two-component system, LytTR family, sensor kinase